MFVFVVDLLSNKCKKRSLSRQLSGVMTNGTSKTAKIKKVITLLQHIAKMSTAAEVSPF